jgi:hypothetical protein
MRLIPQQVKSIFGSPHKKRLTITSYLFKNNHGGMLIPEVPISIQASHKKTPVLGMTKPAFDRKNVLKLKRIADAHA